MVYSQWSTLAGLPSDTNIGAWIPQEDQERVKAYRKYDQMYWNDPRQYSLRVLEGEDPIYVPNARTIVDTTSHYLMKDMVLRVPQPDHFSTLALRLQEFLDRETFYARFQVAKHTGIARGDFVFHLSANPLKQRFSRISLNSVNPSSVFPVWDSNSPDKMVACFLVEPIYVIGEDGQTETQVKKLTYRLVEALGQRRVFREEAVYRVSPPWYSEDAENTSYLRHTIAPGLLDVNINTIPVYWFKNLPWDGQTYGSSDLRGIETILKAISQGTTDTQGALSLEGLGVYATDGGRPIDDNGNEVNWEISPGKVMEVPPNSKFWRVQGVGTISPMKEQLERLEKKMHEGAGLTAVALGGGDIPIATSGVALTIQFSPTLAKIEERDIFGVARLNQLFYDWKVWHQAFEQEILEGEIVPELGAKLPVNRVELVNELNNMLDRRVISTRYYRDQMAILGYKFPDSIESDIVEDVELAAKAVPLSQNDELNRAVNGNNSNNASRPNESSGTETDDEEITSSDSEEE